MWGLFFWPLLTCGRGRGGRCGRVGRETWQYRAVAVLAAKRGRIVVWQRWPCGSWNVAGRAAVMVIVLTLCPCRCSGGDVLPLSGDVWPRAAHDSCPALWITCHVHPEDGRRGYTLKIASVVGGALV